MTKLEVFEQASRLGYVIGYAIGYYAIGDVPAALTPQFIYMELLARHGIEDVEPEEPSDMTVLEATFNGAAAKGEYEAGSGREPEHDLSSLLLGVEFLAQSEVDYLIKRIDAKEGRL